MIDNPSCLDTHARTSIRKRIATTWTGLDVPLGLGEPVLLLGGDAVAPDRLPLELTLDWASGLQDAVSAACLEQTRNNQPWFTMRPVCISAEHGTGRTLLARHIARNAGVPFASLDLNLSPFGKGQGHRPPHIAFPSFPALAIAASGCANPLILVTGIECADDETLDQVCAMIDPATNTRWNEPSLNAILDLSHITWLIKTSATCGPPARMSHLKRVDIELNERDLRLRALTLIREVLADLNQRPEAVATNASGLISCLADASTKSSPDLRAVAERAIRAALKGRR